MLAYLDGKGRGWPARWPMSWGPLAAIPAVIGAGASIAGATGALTATTASIIGAGSALGSAALSVGGAMAGASGMRTAGDNAVLQAQLRGQQAEMEAAQLRESANQEMGAGQRQQIADLTKGDIMMGRAQAVMAAGGAGVDPKLLAAIKGQADYAASVDSYNASEKARVLSNRAKLAEYGIDTGMYTAGQDKSALDTRADNTLAFGVAGAGLSLASKYGGPFKSPNAVTGGTGDSLTQAGSERIAQGSIDAAGGPVIYGGPA